ncbi:hypothetical protein V2G26_001867 [Clonostachys chloroleuca]|uniref:Neutral protease 2 n=1 Tax=Clonostachys chloroleuca TaxID=1926264 RepID=A0AA35LQ43_9HYPO|nr:unnamed protein product [Clonostachys chloroleuca]
MKTAAIFSALLGLASAAAVDLTKRASPLDVKVEQLGNTGFKASITNTGDSALRVLKTGSILDSAPVEKARISQNAKSVPFTGPRFFIHTENLSDSAFQVIAAGETVEVEWDAAQWHDLGAGGDFDIATTGSLQYANEGSNTIVGQVVYSSDTIQAKVDGTQAAEVFSAFKIAQHEKRVTVQNDCSGTKKTAVTNAISKAKSYAQSASSAATAGTRLNQYFHSTSSSTKSTVASVFDKTASQFSSSTSGAVKLYCTDVGNWCTDGVVAYTQPGSSEYIVLCDYWFQFPASSTSCHAADQPYVLVHEATHLVAVKGTDDVCYGYEGCVTSISASQSLNNADSYALYSNGILANC